MNKKINQFSVIGCCFLLTLTACGIFKSGSKDSLYNKENREKVHLKKGFLTKLFSAKSVSFGSTLTSAIESNIDHSVITFPDYHQPFHFSLMNDEVMKAKVNAVYTGRNTFKKDSLPESFYKTAISKVFYVNIKGNGLDSINHWEMILKNPSYEELGESIPVGILKAGSEKVEILALDRGGKKSYDRLTFEFQYRNRPVAAVNVGTKKEVWIHQPLKKSLEPGIIGGIAALLLR